MKCSEYSISENIIGESEVNYCDNEATHTSCEGPVCGQHKCRHSISFSEDARRKNFAALAKAFASLADAIELNEHHAGQCRGDCYRCDYQQDEGVCFAARILYERAPHLFRHGKAQ